MPLAIPGYHLVRKSSALPVGINRIAFESPFFVVRPRPVISETAGTSITAEEDPGPSEQGAIAPILTSLKFSNGFCRRPCD
jgi:hypothetical protein